MKKQIKDLTREECEKICKKYPLCCGCPFYINWEYCFQEELFKEVEIDE